MQQNSELSRIASNFQILFYPSYRIHRQQRNTLPSPANIPIATSFTFFTSDFPHHLLNTPTVLPTLFTTDLDTDFSCPHHKYLTLKPLILWIYMQWKPSILVQEGLRVNPFTSHLLTCKTTFQPPQIYFINATHTILVHISRFL